MTLLGGAAPRLHSTYREKVRTVNLIEVDVAIVGGGGAGLRAPIAAAEVDSGLKIALISKVYPMRSHTVAAEGGSAGVLQASDSLEDHFHDTVAGGDWLCDQDVVDYFVAHCTEEMMQLEHWGCPWSRKPDGHVNVRGVRRDEDRAHLVRGRQERLPHPAHPVPRHRSNIHRSGGSTSISASTSSSRRGVARAWSQSRLRPGSSCSQQGR
jgi:hypothetical protein